MEKIFSKDSSKHTLFQQAYDTGNTAPISCLDNLGQRSFPNKRKAPTYSLMGRNLKAFEGRQKIPAARTKMDSVERQSMTTDALQQRMYLPGTTNIGNCMVDNAKERLQCHTQFLTYHLEKFPSRYKREALTEKKLVALLKLLAQQLVKRLDAAEKHPSCLLDGKVQAHAVSLRSNLEKLQKELHTTVKALEGSYPHNSREKSSGYIVLPSKLERDGHSEDTHMKLARGFEQEGPNLSQIKDALNKQAAFLYHDLSSETAASSTSVSFDSSPQEIKKVSQYRVLDEDCLKHKKILDSSIACEESNKAVLVEVKTSDDMFQDLDSRLQSFCMDSKHETIHRGKLTWDHQLLDKELEKLDAEIRETKSRMSRNLFSSLPHPADTDCVLSPLANSSRCSDNATPVLGVWSVSSTMVLATTEEKVDLPSAPEEDVGLQNIHDDRSELNTTALEGRTSRESDGSTLVAEILHANEKMVKSNVIMEIEEGDMVSANSVIDSRELDVKLPLCTARNDTPAFSTSLETSSCCVAKPHSDFSTEAIPSHLYVGKFEVCQMSPVSASTFEVQEKVPQESACLSG